MRPDGRAVPPWRTMARSSLCQRPVALWGARGSGSPKACAASTSVPQRDGPVPGGAGGEPAPVLPLRLAGSDTAVTVLSQSQQTGSADSHVASQSMQAKLMASGLLMVQVSAALNPSRTVVFVSAAALPSGHPNTRWEDNQPKAMRWPHLGGRLGRQGNCWQVNLSTATPTLAATNAPRESRPSMPVSVDVPVVVALIEHPRNPDCSVRYVRHSDRYGTTYEEFVGVFADVDAAQAALYQRTGYPDGRNRMGYVERNFTERDNGDLAYRIPDQGGPDTKRTLVARTVTL